jgi:predicted RNase H-like nuclease (RuvC/YqgF family)
MDEYTELLKEYIRPYDERIKKLEENAKEKNIEISLLKAAADQMKIMIERLEVQIKNLNQVPVPEVKGKNPVHSPSKIVKTLHKPKK